VFVRLGELGQFRIVVDVGIGHFETAGPSADVCFDVGDAINFFQIASDRGGTATSDHVWDFEGHERELGRRRLARIRRRCLRDGSGLAAGQGYGEPGGD
jgi:hypothetical protein